MTTHGSFQGFCPCRGASGDPRIAGMPLRRPGEARRAPACPVLSRVGQFGSGLSSRGSPKTLATSSEEIVDRRAHRRRCTLMSGLSSGIAHTKFPERGIALTVPPTTQAAWSRRRSCPTLSGSSCCPPCFGRACAHRRCSFGLFFRSRRSP